MRILLFVMAIAFSLPDTACAVDPLVEARERLDQFFLHVHETSREYSVVGLISSTKKPKNPDEDVKYTETLFRKVVAKQRMRFEVATREPMANRGTTLFEHNLVLPNRFLHAFDVHIASRINAIDDTRLARMDPLGKTDPVAYALSTGNLGVSTSQLEKNWSGFKFYSAERLRNNGLRARALHENGRGIAELTFEGDPEWKISRLREFLNPRDPIDPSAFKPIETRDWSENSDTITQWAEVSSKRVWVPHTITTWRKESEWTRESESQLQLVDWKFGNDVLVRLLEESTFTNETLSQEIDFDELAKLFEPAPRTKKP
jgi:hypothetical protein